MCCVFVTYCADFWLDLPLRIAALLQPLCSPPQPGTRFFSTHILFHSSILPMELFILLTVGVRVWPVEWRHGWLRARHWPETSQNQKWWVLSFNPSIYISLSLPDHQLQRFCLISAMYKYINMFLSCISRFGMSQAFWPTRSLAFWLRTAQAPSSAPRPSPAPPRSTWTTPNYATLLHCPQAYNL